MKKFDVTMVHPRQIVNKGLKGCNSTRTVTTFAQKYGVPTAWWSPKRNEKVLLVDWPQFKTLWNQYKTSTGPFAPKTSYTKTGTGSFMTKKPATASSKPYARKSSSRSTWTKPRTRTYGTRRAA